MSVEWNNLSATQREPYNKIAEKDKVRYQNEMKTYIKKTPSGASESKKGKNASVIAKGSKVKKDQSKQEVVEDNE